MVVWRLELRVASFKCLRTVKVTAAGRVRNKVIQGLSLNRARFVNYRFFTTIYLTFFFKSHVLKKITTMHLYSIWYKYKSWSLVYDHISIKWRLITNHFNFDLNGFTENQGLCVGRQQGAFGCTRGVGMWENLHHGAGG